MNNPVNTSVFDEELGAYSMKLPKTVMKLIDKEAKQMGRSRNKHVTALLAEHLGIIINPPQGE